jgi:Uncharacterized conserved protein, contains double-stranded beta-helix domain
MTRETTVRAAAAASPVTFSRIPAASLSTAVPIITRLLPHQGSIEVQHDQAGKEHAWHTHPTDETLVILEGKVRFYHEAGERICEPGDVIHLPAEVRHGSVALDGGAVYLIAMQAHSPEALAAAVTADRAHGEPIHVDA